MNTAIVVSDQNIDIDKTVIIVWIRVMLLSFGKKYKLFIVDASKLQIVIIPKCNLVERVSCPQTVLKIWELSS